ncbi:MFS-type transporter [Lachnellula suecica]|uniref:MFS-type transporter n=1 Tax=Lachnellula suecica TaxID=602035 RepID=A0A8T9BU44_9HELO|nr:MFS-type transporter [Lachnellula suecica]
MEEYTPAHTPGLDVDVEAGIQRAHDHPPKSSSLPAEPLPATTQKSEHQDETPLPPRMPIIMLSLCMAIFLAALDVTIVATAIPKMSADLHTSQSAYSWIGSAYLLPYAALSPFWGKLSDVFGRKPLLLAANVVFFVGSLMCGFANSVAMLIAGRAVQGTGGGGLVVIVNITVADLVSQRQRGTYMGVISMVWATASAVGPVIGGILVEKVSWRWCFYINLPCTAAAFIALLLFLKVHNPRTNFLDGIAAIDWLGTLLVLGGTLMLLLGLQYGSITYHWNSAPVICLIVFGIAIYGIFVIVEWKVAKYPLMPLRLLKRRETLAILGVVSCHGFVLMAVNWFMAFYFQNALGATPIESAIWALPLAVTLPLISMATGIFIAKTGRYLELIIVGMGIAVLGTGLYVNLSASKSWTKIIVFPIIAAVGLGTGLQAPLIALQSKVAPADNAVATALFAFARNLSSAISVVVGGVIIQNRMQIYISQFKEAGIPGSVITQLVSGTGGSASIVKSLTDAQQELATGAIADSLSKMWIFYTCLLFFGFILSWGIGTTKLSTEHEHYKTGLDTEETNRVANERKEVRGSCATVSERGTVLTAMGAQSSGAAAQHEIP